MRHAPDIPDLLLQVCFAGMVLAIALRIILYVIVMNQARGECLALLACWAEENGQYLLEAKSWWFVHILPWRFEVETRIAYWVRLEDRAGQVRTILMDCVGQCSAGEFIPRSVAFRNRNGWPARSVIEKPRPRRGDPLWDAWVDW